MAPSSKTLISNAGSRISSTSKPLPPNVIRKPSRRGMSTGGKYPKGLLVPTHLILKEKISVELLNQIHAMVDELKGDLRFTSTAVARLHKVAEEYMTRPDIACERKFTAL